MQRHGTIDRFKLILFITVCAMIVVIGLSGVRSSAVNKGNTPDDSTGATNSTAPGAQQETKPAATPTPRPEGCIECHGNVEPMHQYNQEGTRLSKITRQGKDGVGLTCTQCHGGNPAVYPVSPRTTENDKEVQRAAHVRPRFPDEWENNSNEKNKKTGANPANTSSLLEHESFEFVRFVNPGDLRVVNTTCGKCHTQEVNFVSNSMMAHGAMLWGAALYNNGGFPDKDARFGESYSETGAPQRLISSPKLKPGQTADQLRDLMHNNGILSFLDPIPRWEISQPGNVLRVFERGGKRRLEVGLPDKDEDPGKPDKGLSPRGLGTNNRTDPVYLGLQKTRLLDPTLNMLGTNDHPGDYRSSGCTACHTIYANDRNPLHSAMYASYGNMGQSASADRNINPNAPEETPTGKTAAQIKSGDDSGHPVKHQFTSQIPTSQCMTCHMHPGTNMVATYLGLTWWDNESDADKMYPAQQVTPSQDFEQKSLNLNPEASSLRGKWSDLGFLAQTGTPEFNNQLKRTQIADFHGHGWIFRAVFKRNRQGEFLDKDGHVIPEQSVTPAALQKAVLQEAGYREAGVPVHLKDIHLEKGMHCVDCHFQQDAHGNGNLYNEPRAAIEIGCIDCHGTVDRKGIAPDAKNKRTIITSGPAAGSKFTNGTLTVGAPPNPVSRNLNGSPQVTRFQVVTKDTKYKGKPFVGMTDGSGKTVQEGDIIQFSSVDPDKWWRIPQTVDTITPGRQDYSEKSEYAKTIERDNETWGVPTSGKVDMSRLAHTDNNMTCFSCHSSWMTSCFGCHLSMSANRKMPNRHNEGGNSRNYTTYNFQVLRDDVFMLGRDGTATGHRIAPVRSSSAVLVSSQNQNREWIYHQQQTVSAEGYAGQAFNTHVPHTVRSTETKGCSDCHVSKQNDNNAWLAQLLLQGTNFVNFMGHYVYVAADDSLEAVVVTKHTEPQAVIGSTLEKYAYRSDYDKFVNGGRELKTAFEHVGNPRALQVQVRGEYAYVAAGEGGLRVYDVAQIDQKGFSERISTAPVSPFGQKFYVKTKYATAVAAPSTLAVDPARWRTVEDAQASIGCSAQDKTESGLIVSPACAKTIYDAWQKRYDDWQRLPESAKATTQMPVNPLLNEEQPIHPLYAYLYVVDKYEGLIVVNAATLLDGDPLNNYLKRQLTDYPDGAFNPNHALDGANNITIAGRFAYITTDSKLAIVDLSDPLHPKIVREIGTPQLNHPRAIAIQLRYGFIADADGFKVLDITDIERSADSVQLVARDGRAVVVPLAEAQDVYVARTYAYVADGKDGIAIIDVTQPDNPQPPLMFNADGKLNDTHQVKVAMTNASLYAYVADGRNGLRVLQLTDPETMSEYAGFSPRPRPVLIAWYKTKGEALAISKGLDRDRAVDESGNQIAVFGRRGARPFNLEEMDSMFRTNKGKGSFFTVTDTPPPKRRNARDQNSPGQATSLSSLLPLNFKGASGKTGAIAVIGCLGLCGAALGWRRLRRRR